MERSGAGTADDAAPDCFTRRFFGLYPAEAIVLSFAVLALALYAIVGTPLRYPADLYTQRVYHSFVFYTIGLLITVFVLRFSEIRRANLEPGERLALSKTWLRYKHNYLNLGQIVHDLRLLHAVALMFVVYINLKHLIPFLAYDYFDDSLLAWESRLFGATSTEHLISFFGVGAAPLLSKMYKLFYNYTAFLIIIMVLQRPSRFAQRFLAAFVLVWLIGILMVFALPTLGPCFSSPEVVSLLPFTEVSEMQSKLWAHKTAMDLDIHSRIPVYLISGFPSLHLAVPIVGSIFLGERYPRLAALSWMFVFITGITTIYFGWHFLLDDIGSLVLALTAVKASNLLVGKVGSDGPEN